MNQYFRSTLYFLLLVTAVATLFSRPYLIEAIRLQQINPFWVFIGPLLFAFFFLIHVAERLLSRQKKKRLSFLTVVFGSLILVFLVPSSLREYKTRNAPRLEEQAFYINLLKNKDARIRAVTLLAASNQVKDKKQLVLVLEKGLDDSDPLVQEAAMIALEQRIGVQLGEEHNLKDIKRLLIDWKHSL